MRGPSSHAVKNAKPSNRWAQKPGAIWQNAILQLPFNFAWPLILSSSQGYTLNKVQHSQAFCALAGSTKPETPVRDNGCQGGSYQIKLQAWKKDCFTGHITLLHTKLPQECSPLQSEILSDDVNTVNTVENKTKIKAAENP